MALVGEEMFSLSSCNSAAIEGIFLSAFRHVETGNESEEEEVDARWFKNIIKL